MRRLRTGHTLGAGLIGLSLLFVSPDTGASQHPFTTGTAVRPLGSGLTSLSAFNWNGIWVKYGGSWAWRPTAHYDWQAMFRCRSGYGSGAGWGAYSPWGWGFHYTRGWGFHSPWGGPGGWLPDPYSRWDMVPGLGWAWFPSQRYANAWGFWYNGPRYSFGYGGGCDPFGPVFGSSVLLTGWDGGLTLPQPYGSQAAGFRPERWDRSRYVDRNREPWTPTMDTPDHPTAFIDPVAGTPTVELESVDPNSIPLVNPKRGFITVSADDEGRPLVHPVRGVGSVSADPEPKSSVDPVMPVREIEPRTIDKASQDERLKRPSQARPSSAESKPTARSRPSTTPTKPRAAPARRPSATSRTPSSASPRRAATPQRSSAPKARSTGSARPSSSGRSKSTGRASPASPTRGKKN